MRTVLILVLFLLLIACGKKDDDVPEKAPAPDNRIEQVQAEVDRLEARAVELANADGWVIWKDCDSFHWAGRAGAASETLAFRPEASEFPNEPGRFSREPTREACEDTWSRDAGLIGLFPFAIAKRRLDLIERHAEHCERNRVLFQGFPMCQMGEPLRDGRTLYTPSMIGIMYQVQAYLGGNSHTDRAWPNLYPPGLDDYQAHLQVTDIWTRGIVAGELEAKDDCPNKDAEPGTISRTMYDRLVEHHNREPGCPFYGSVWGKYSGDMGPAIDAFLGGLTCSYVRCGAEEERCVVAERLNAGRIILKAFEKT